MSKKTSKRVKKGRKRVRKKNPSPEVLVLHLSNTSIPEGKSITADVESYHTRRILKVYVRILDGGVTRDVFVTAELLPWLGARATITWDVLSAFPRDTDLTAYAYGTDAVTGATLESNRVLFRIVSTAKQIVVKFTDTKGVAHYPAIMILQDKLTGRTWSYEADPDGNFYLPTKPPGSEHILILLADRPAERLFALRVMDPYDWKPHHIMEDLRDRYILRVTLKPDRMDNFANGMNRLMPPPLQEVQTQLATKYGLVSDQVYDVIDHFLASFLIEPTGTRIIRVEHNLPAKEITVHAVLQHGGLIAGALLAAGALIKAHFVKILVAVVVSILAFSWVEVERQRTARVEAKKRMLEEMADLRREEKITEETFKAGVEAINEYDERLTAATPIGIPWHLIFGLVGTVIAGSILIMLLRLIPPPKPGGR